MFRHGVTIDDVSNKEEVLGVQGNPGCGTDGALVNISEQNGMRLSWLL